MEPVKFTYRNHHGQIELRTVIPEAIEFIERPEFGYQPGWFLIGQDMDRDARRSFSLSHISYDGLHLRFRLAPLVKEAA